MVSTGLQSLMALSPNLAQSSISMSCEGVLGFKIHFESLLVSLFALVCNPPTSPRSSASLQEGFAHLHPPARFLQAFGTTCCFESSQMEGTDSVLLISCSQGC